MARKVFYSFHYKPDGSRASQVRNAGILEGNQSCSDNAWETITSQGDSAIQNWIDGQLSGRACAVVLIGSGTAGRKWINYEITKAWDSGKGVVGVYIHNLKDFSGAQSSKGANPFSKFTIGGTAMSSIVEAHDPPYTDSKTVYGHIQSNLADWVETAISIRGQY